MSGLLPVVSHQCCALLPAELDDAAQLAAKLLREQPELRLPPIYQDLAVRHMTGNPSLHVDDLKGIQRVKSGCMVYQGRARLRAVDGDMIATTMSPVDGYESYCREHLGLGSVEWISPKSLANPLSLAEACWQDRAVRRELVHQIRKNDLKYLHPHMGTEAVWELALLLSRASHRAVEVIAPPPAVARFANDKGMFAKLVQAMFGVNATPATTVVWNIANAAKKMQQLAETHRVVAIKLPSAAGGDGIMLFPMAQVRGRPVRELDDLLARRLSQIEYDSGNELLVTVWAEDLVACPSAQLWLPPTAQGPPIVEGLFMQVIDAAANEFTGFVPAQLPEELNQQITRRCLLLARVFQVLGYVGRCSFDMLLVGPDLAQSRMEYIECNGRWGGTSLPMTLMNQIFGDWQTQPFTSRTLKIKQVQQLSFRQWMSELAGDLYHKTSATAGNCILYNPQRSQIRDEISVIALHPNWADGGAAISSLKRRIEAVVAGRQEVV